MAVSRDATKGWYCPANLSEWGQLLVGTTLATPNALWLCQENGTAGQTDLADSLAGAFPLLANGAGSITYADTIAGWSRKAITIPAGNVRMFSTTVPALPDISIASCMVLALARWPGSASTTRSIITLGPTFGSQVAANFNNVPKFVGVADPNTVQSAQAAFFGFGSDHVMLVGINRTGGNAFVQTESDLITPTLTGTPTGKRVMIGGDNVQSWAASGTSYFYLAAWFNAAAEMSPSDRTTLINRIINGPPQGVSRGLIVNSGRMGGVSRASIVNARAR